MRFAHFRRRRDTLDGFKLDSVDFLLLLGNDYRVAGLPAVLKRRLTTVYHRIIRLLFKQCLTAFFPSLRRSCEISAII